MGLGKTPRREAADPAAEFAEEIKMATYVDVDDVLWAGGDAFDKEVPVASVVDGENRKRTVLDDMMGLFVERETYRCFSRVGAKKGFILKDKRGSAMLTVALPKERGDPIEVANAHNRGIFALQADRTDEHAYELIFRDSHANAFTVSGPDWERSCFSVQGSVAGLGFGSSLNIKFSGDVCFGPFLRTYIMDDHDNILASVQHSAPGVDREYTGIEFTINECPEDTDLGLVVVMFIGYILIRKYETVVHLAGGGWAMESTSTMSEPSKRVSPADFAEEIKMATHVDINDTTWEGDENEVPMASVVNDETRRRSINDEWMSLFAEQESYKCYARVGTKRGYILKDSRESVMLTIVLPQDKDDPIEIVNAHNRGIFALQPKRIDEHVYEFVFRDSRANTFTVCGPDWERSCFSVQGSVAGTGFGSSLKIKFSGDVCFGPFLNTIIADDVDRVLATVHHGSPGVDREFTGLQLTINKCPADTDVGLVVVMFIAFILIQRYESD
ncbi:Hypothetical Protein FCC1311_001902 [Hondaea fermentalgiana]|uniref:Uncharacterized protein n=1 Tax=Hondaea fermentalgiana TaxID=2315210 RepID=A0A2R5G7F5_9STRA|nr:Hypothetical Protein FCC1311_001902 [Hondaea fermentalgiana]|eukprot:GBG23971.1 Hypothetical Protein FCC1311_001902 [Hondaea fermentalgiana]